MKKVLVTAFLFLSIISVASVAFADTWVSGYFRSDGTYVNGHYRSDPDGNFYNNYSTVGNTNPYTGQAGYKRYDYSSRYDNYSSYDSDYDYSYDDDSTDYGYSDDYEYSSEYDYSYDDEYDYDYYDSSYDSYYDDYEEPTSFWSWLGY